MKADDVFVSIGIPFFNAEKYLALCIDSVLAQTHKNWELILIDDGSTDKSLEIALSYKDKRIRVLSDGLNKKLPARLNEIIEVSQYDYIARMDADDIMSPFRIQLQLEYLINYPHIDLVSTSLYSISNDNELNGVRTCRLSSPTKKQVLLGSSGIVHASLLVRKNWYKRNKYNEKIYTAQDYELWVSAMIKNDLKVGFLQDYLYYYREEDNVTKKKMLYSYKTQIKVIKKYHKGILSINEYILNLLKIYIKILVTHAFYFLSIMKVLYKFRNKEAIKAEHYSDFDTQLTRILK